MEADVSSGDNVKLVEFNGEAGEYFRIWIVNLALTIVTLGIYSAWATVRNRRYFYTHTFVADGSFDFHARPQAILIGRIIAVAMLGLYLLSGYIHPLAPLVVVVFIFLVVPWLVVRSRIFRMRNSSYRGIRFNFRKNYADALKVYYGGALVAAVSLGFATPTALFWRNEFAVNNSGFGRTDFTFGGDSGRFYAYYYTMVGLAIVGIILYFIFMIAMAGLGPGPDRLEGSALTLWSYAITLPILAYYLALGVYLQVRIRNHIWNTATLGDNSFISTLSVREMIWIYLTNIFAIVVSIGLLVPWAQVRLAKYRAEHTQVVLADDWESYIAADRIPGSALGDEVGEAFDVEVDLGF